MADTEILYQGHASLRLKSKDGKIIYIDPYLGEGYDLPADLILVSHQHPDHNKINRPKHKEKTQILQNFDFTDGKVYKTADLGDIHIRSVEAYNRNHPKGTGVGFIIEVDGKKIYIAGDTAKTDQMDSLKNEKIDYAFLPIDGIFTMSPEEAADCAKLIGATHVIPYHMNPGSLFDQNQADRLKIENKLILKPGETLTL